MSRWPVFNLPVSPYLLKRKRSLEEVELHHAARQIIESFDQGYIDIVSRGEAEDEVTLAAFGRLREAVDKSAL